MLASGIVLLLALFVLQRLIAPSDTHEIEAVLETVATSHDPSYCREDVTQAYLEQSTGAKAPFADELCESSVPGADSVEVRQIDIDGNRATAVVDHHGGYFDGSSLVNELVEVDGEWRLNRRIGFARFDRASFDRAYGESFLEFGSSATAAECAVAKQRRFSDAEIKRMVLDGDLGAFSRILVQCDRPGAERSLIEGLQRPPYDELPAQAIACVEARLKAVADARLARLTDDLVAYGALLVNCDEEAVFDLLARRLSDESGLQSEAVECVVGALRGLSHADFIRLTYDQEKYDEVVEGCRS